MIMVCNFPYTHAKPTYFLLPASDSIYFLQCLTEKSEKNRNSEITLITITKNKPYQFHTASSVKKYSPEKVTPTSDSIMI